MNELMNLDFEGTPVRVITADDGTPRWALADVCAACGIANPRNVAARLDARQKGVVTMDTLGGPQKITVVNEDGLYDVILDSRKPEARRFRKWVTGEVLPSIRKHGAYMTPDTIRQALADPDTLIMLATRLKEETEERVATQERVRVLEPKARAYEDFCEAPDLLTVRGRGGTVDHGGPADPRVRVARMDARPPVDLPTWWRVPALRGAQHCRPSASRAAQTFRAAP